MELSASILGKDIVTRLQDRQRAAVLTIGTDQFSRAQLSRIGCFNFQSAARLSHLITVELKVKDTRDLFRNVSPAHLAIPGLGAVTLAVLGAAFEVKGIGTLSEYVARHLEKDQTLVTFVTMKQHAADTKAAARERKTIRARQERRGRTAHEYRVARHLERHAATA